MFAKVISCPNCGQLQLMEYTYDSKLYYPVKPYCCEVMEYCDTTVWNLRLDEALQKPFSIFQGMVKSG